MVAASGLPLWRYASKMRGMCPRRSITLLVVVPIAVSVLSAGTVFTPEAAAHPPPLAVAGFDDVLEGAYYSEAVLWASQIGLVDGGDGSVFAPEHEATRALSALSMWRMQSEPAAPTHSFTDVEVDSAIGQAVSWMVDAGVTTGTSRTTFSPSNGLTRGELAAFLW